MVAMRRVERLYMKIEVGDAGERIWPPQPDTYFPGPAQILDEGYDETGSPLGVPVHWSLQRRGGVRVNCSTFAIPRAVFTKQYAEFDEFVPADQDVVTMTIEAVHTDSIAGKVTSLSMTRDEMEFVTFRHGAQVFIMCEVAGTKLRVGEPRTETLIPGAVEIVNQGMIRDNSVLGVRVRWRVERRDGRIVVTNTFVTPREFIERTWPGFNGNLPLGLQWVGIAQEIIEPGEQAGAPSRNGRLRVVGRGLSVEALAVEAYAAWVLWLGVLRETN